jgi:hypothetical protein
VPTTRPRYTVTDTGELAEMLDLAARRWPDVHDRRRLLLALAAAGRDSIAEQVGREDRRALHERQERAMESAGDLVDENVLLSDAAWS